MPIDSRIALGFNPQQLDAGSAMQKGLTLRDMKTKALETERLDEERMTMNDVLKRHTQVGADGRAQVNRSGALSELNGKVDQSKVMAFQKQLDDMDTDTLARTTQQAKALAWSVTPDNYAAKRQEAIQAGLPNADKIPEYYSPQFVERWQLGTLEGEKQLQYRLSKSQQNQTASYQNRSLALQEQALMQKDAAAKAKAQSLAVKPNEGQKVVDRKFAEEYNEWTSGGYKNALSEIDKLKNVSKKLGDGDGQVTTGGLTGMFPDRMTSNDLLSVRADVESTVMNSLRAILGSAFTEKEGQRIIANTWNEADSTKNNLARIDRLVADLENKASDKQSKALFFEQGNTLNGYKPAPGGMQASYNQKSPRSEASPGQTFTTDQIDWAE